MPDVSIVIDGEPATVPDGVSVAAALIRHGVRAFRRVNDQPRGPVCGMGATAIRSYRASSARSIAC